MEQLKQESIEFLQHLQIRHFRRDRRKLQGESVEECLLFLKLSNNYILPARRKLCIKTPTVILRLVNKILNQMSTRESLSVRPSKTNPSTSSRLKIFNHCSKRYPPIVQLPLPSRKIAWNKKLKIINLCNVDYLNQSPHQPNNMPKHLNLTTIKLSPIFKSTHLIKLKNHWAKLNQGALHSIQFYLQIFL